jgi:hypothetical protein
MHLSKDDLFQMNEEWLKKIPAELLRVVSKPGPPHSVVIVA